MNDPANDIKYPKRKPNRLKHYDYSNPGLYFITISAKIKHNYFWQEVGARIARPQDVRLSEYGSIVDKAINMIPEIYPLVLVESYVIMPDHIHLLLHIRSSHDIGANAPEIGKVVNQLKGFVTKHTGQRIWQKLYYDHVIRNYKEYEEIKKYIYYNPINRYLTDVHEDPVEDDCYENNRI